MPDLTAPPEGLFGSLRRLGETALALLQNRLELIGLELGEEKARLVSILVWTAAMILMGFLALIALSCILVVLFWDHALLVLGLLSAVFALGALGAWMRVRGQISGPAPFQESVEQLKKDRDWLLRRG